MKTIEIRRNKPKPETLVSEIKAPEILIPEEILPKTKISEETKISETKVSGETKSKIIPPGAKKNKYSPDNAEQILYVLVRVRSKRKLQDIVDFFQQIASPDPNTGKILVDTKGLRVVGCARIEHDRPEDRRKNTKQCDDDWLEYVEYDKSIISLHPAVVEYLDDSEYCRRPGIHDIYIQRFKIFDNNRTPKGCDPKRLFCGFKNTKYISSKSSLAQVEQKMYDMIECGFITEDQYN